jgi:hypothetical protein
VPSLGIPSLPKFGKNLMDPPPGFWNRVHLWLWLAFVTLFWVGFDVWSGLGIISMKNKD